MGYAEQVRCIICKQYNVDTNDCKLAKCEFSRMNYSNRKKLRYRRNREDICRDLLGNKIEDDNE